MHSAFYSRHETGEAMDKTGRSTGSESNSSGGLSMFRDIDRSGAFCTPEYHILGKNVTLQSLETWFSTARLHRYATASRPDLLYIWNARLSKAFLEDFGHVEVLLRNFIHERLTKDCGQEDWYEAKDRYHFNGPFQSSVAKVKRKLKNRGRLATPDQVIAELSFDNWRFLLTPRHEVTIWKALIDLDNGGMPHYSSRDRVVFENDVECIRQLRNRASHQEPLIIEAKQTETENKQLDAYVDAIAKTAERIDPRAAAWIMANSRVATIRKLRPT